MVAPIEIVPLSPKACASEEPRSPRDQALALQVWQGPALAPEELLKTVKASERRLSELLVPRIEARTAALVSCLLSLSLRSALAAERQYALKAPRRACGDGQVRGLPPLLPPPSPKSPSPHGTSPDATAPLQARLKRHAHNQSAPGNLSGQASPEATNGSLPNALSSETQQQRQNALDTAASEDCNEAIVEERFAPECIHMGLSMNMGQRSCMEDFAFAMPLTRPDIPGCWFNNGACFGVFDGHGGHEVAQSLAEHVPVKIQDSVHHIASTGPQRVGEILLRHERRLRQEPNIWSPSGTSSRLPPRYPQHTQNWGRGVSGAHRPRSYGAGADPPLADMLVPTTAPAHGMRRGHSSAVALSAFHNAPQGLVAVKTGRLYTASADMAPGSPQVGSGAQMALDGMWSWSYENGHSPRTTTQASAPMPVIVTSPVAGEQQAAMLIASASHPQPFSMSLLDRHDASVAQNGQHQDQFAPYPCQSSPQAAFQLPEHKYREVWQTTGTTSELSGAEDTDGDAPVVIQCGYLPPLTAAAVDTPAGDDLHLCGQSCPPVPSALCAAPVLAAAADAPHMLAPHTRSQSDVGLSDSSMQDSHGNSPLPLLPQQLQRPQPEASSSASSSSNMLEQQPPVALQPLVPMDPHIEDTGGEQEEQGEFVGQQEDFKEVPWEDDTSGFMGRDPGSTALVATIIDGNMFVANVGDCRLILAELDPSTGRVVARPITNDHVPAVHKGEAARLAALRVPVSDDGYVGPGGGFLQVSRSIGDFSTKTQLGEQVILSEPELHTVHLGPNSLFAVAASDGVTCAMSDDTIINQVCNFLNATNPETGDSNDPHYAAEQLVRYAVDAANSPDNASAVVTCFKLAKPPLPQRPKLFGGRGMQQRRVSVPAIAALLP